MSPKNRSHWLNVATMRGAVVAAVIGGVITGLMFDGLHYLIG
ncbi:hypothetical protein AB0D10_41715 [Kitasatospora sp. NPDC048545]